MLKFWDKVRILVSGLLEPRRSVRHVSPSRSADWLPPVLGPEDYAIGIMAGRSASWYFD